MEEIKVGEYVRSRQGYIAKVIKIEEDYGIEFNKSIIRRYGAESDMLYLNPEYTWEDERNEIKDHSFEIADLIEEGDYVNGCEVFQVTATQLIVRDENGLSMWEKKRVEKYIKHIVTHEQFNSIKYTVGE